MTKCAKLHCDLKSHEEAQTICEAEGGTLLEEYNVDFDGALLNRIMSNTCSQYPQYNYWLGGNEVVMNYYINFIS